MKKIIIITALLCYWLTTFSQDITGNWVGNLDIQGSKLKFAFNIEKDGDGYISTMDIPQQGLNNGKVESTVFKDSILKLSLPKFQIVYEGRLNKENQIIGEISQGGQPFDMILIEGKIELNRPQEPKAPFDYYTEEVQFKNAVDNVNLFGTLTLPKKNGKFPVVIIVSGSGPHNRDGEMFSHKPYLILADHLTQNGIGVLRFDERGVGKSEGNFNNTSLEQFTADVEMAIDYLKNRKEIDKNRIGLIGHSIGGIIAPTIASKRNDINFLVLLASPGVDGDKLMLEQKASKERLMGLNEEQIIQSADIVKGAYEIIKNSEMNIEQLKDTLNNHFIVKYDGQLPENQRKAIVAQITSFEMIGIIQSKPSEYLKKINCPVLALNGSKDFQVTSKQNLTAIENSLLNKNKNKILELKNLNHLFQQSETGDISEYSEIEETFSPKALIIISDWIEKQAE